MKKSVNSYDKNLAKLLNQCHKYREQNAEMEELKI